MIVLIIAFLIFIIFFFVRKSNNGGARSQSSSSEDGLQLTQMQDSGRESFERFKKKDDAKRLKWAQDAARKIIESAGDPDPRTGYFNMPKWRVSGKKKSTGRLNTVEVRAKTADEAKTAGVALRDMMEPISVSEIPLEKKAYSEDLELRLPAGTGTDDEWALRLSVEASDVEPIPLDFYTYLTAKNIPLSRLSGRNRAATEVLNALSPKGKAALYCYAVDCDRKRITPGNIDVSPRLQVYTSFAEQVCGNQKVMDSIQGRSGNDIWRPNKRTTAYPYTISYLDIT